MSEDFAEEVRRRRSAAGVTQQRLAMLSDVSLSTIQFVESGRTGAPRMRTADAIRRGLEWAEGPSELVATAHGRQDISVDRLTLELAEERSAHQQTLATLRAIRALLDSAGGAA